MVNVLVVCYVAALDAICLAVVILRKDFSDLIAVGSRFIKGDGLEGYCSVLFVLRSIDLLAIRVSQQEAELACLQVAALNELACA